MDKLCALCRTNKDLQNSHIIPELFYQSIYDPKPRRFRVVSSDHKVDELFLQKGIREYLLCRACEQHIGRWEDYAARVFLKGKGVTSVEIDGGLKLQGIDYKTFKLFLLSLLWRMSVSTLEFFRLLKLEPEHEEKLRTAILNDDPLHPSDYCCCLIIVKIHCQLRKDWIMQPSQVRNGQGVRAYWLVINGIMYMFFISGQLPGFMTLPINKRNELCIMDGNASDFSFLREPLAEMNAAVQLRKKGKAVPRKHERL